MLTDEERRQVVSDYESGMTARQVGDRYGLSNATVQYWVRRRGTMRGRRHYCVDESAFDLLTPDAAYWLGFLLTDGCVFEYGFLIELVASDELHLQALRTFLKSEHPIQHPSVRRYAKSFNSTPHALLTIGSKRLAAALARWGVVQRKTHTAEAVPALARNTDFWRGCIDGDGWVSIYDRPYGPYPVIGLCGASARLLHQFASFVGRSTGGNEPRVLREHTVWRVHVTGRMAIALAGELYGGDRPALPRKAQTAAKIIQRANDNPRWCVVGPEAGVPQRRRVAKSSGFRGVHKCADGRRFPFRATIMCDGKKVPLGSFTTSAAAAKAYDDAAARLFGVHAITNGSALIL